MIDKEKLIDKLNLIKHPEGGYYSQSYRSPIVINGKHIGLEKSEYRSLSTSIYFMLSDKEVSNFHRLKSDEVWYYHGGESLVITIIDKNGNLSEQKLGLDIDNGEIPQITVPSGSIFGSYIESGSGISLVGCMVSYGFDFIDFELFSYKELQKKYPKHEMIIKKLTA